MTDAPQTIAAKSRSFETAACKRASLCSLLLLLTIIFLAAALLACRSIPSGLPAIIEAQRHLLAVLIIIAVAISLELTIQRSYKDAFDFSIARTMSRQAFSRICQRCLGLFICLILLTPSILIQQFKAVTGELIAILLLFAAFAPFYFLALERYGKYPEQDDEMLVLCKFASNPLLFLKNLRANNIETDNSTAFFNLCRNLMLKGYFVPQLFASALHFWAAWEEYAASLVSAMQQGQLNVMDQNKLIALIGLIHVCLIQLTSAAGTTMPFAGYLLSLRILGNNIRSTDTTFSGWTFMMLAYLPVCNLPGMFLSRTSILWPVSLWHANFNLTLALSSAVVFFVIINTWSDLTLGLKFSNVSYRGVVKHGPYSIVRHPAYSAKLLGWALALTPSMLTLPGFLAGIFGWLALAAIYIMRALTEERHLSQFPDYREYCASVKKRFVPGLF